MKHQVTSMTPEPEMQQMPEPPQEQDQSLFDLMQASDKENRSIQYAHLCTQIDNILNSYDDEFDAFSELVQNSMDSILERCETAQDDYVPRLDVHIDRKHNQLMVLDNGVGVAPQHLASAIKPNESLKRRLRHKNARGEKGAALVFLQFGHTLFKFESKTLDGQRTYTLHNGRMWFRQMLTAMDSELPFAQRPFPDKAHTISEDIGTELSAFESGCRVTVQFGADCRLESLDDMLGSKADKALNRAEHILRTRTAIGFVGGSDRKDSLPACLQKLQVTLKMTFADESEKDRKIDIGFHYPHLLAKIVGSPTALMTNEKRDSELLYDFITPDFMEKYLTSFWEKSKNRNIAKKYDVRGYFSYAYQNGYYEARASEYMGLNLDEVSQDELPYQLVQINGGFQIAVRGYPNGRRHSFLHRSGAEDKSRTYVVLNFSGDYKPDYGRKNISAEVRPFVLELCKALISFATQRDRKSYYKVGKAEARHNITNLREARDQRIVETNQQQTVGIWLQSTQGPEGFRRPPVWEDELAAEFSHFVLSGRLPGFMLFGLPPNLQYDVLFDYQINRTRTPQVVYDEDTRPLGLYFSGEKQEHNKQWLEFKLSSDKLVDDFKKREGESGKKYFVLVDLLVCDRIDNATDDFDIVEVKDDEQVRMRTYYGVTHFLTSATDRSHVVQVICLQTLRTLLAARPEVFPVIEPLDEE